MIRTYVIKSRIYINIKMYFLKLRIILSGVFHTTLLKKLWIAYLFPGCIFHFILWLIFTFSDLFSLEKFAVCNVTDGFDISRCGNSKILGHFVPYWHLTSSYQVFRKQLAGSFFLI